MASKHSTLLPRLALPREEVEECLQDRVIKGQELIGRQLAKMDKGAVQWFYDEVDRWHEYNSTVLARAFNGDLVTSYVWQKYDVNSRHFWLGGGTLISKIKAEVAQKVKLLESLMERLPVFQESVDSEGASVILRKRFVAPGARSVFVVHGHDDAAREMLARFLEKLGLNAVVLREEVNQGRTLIEKFETCAMVDFAIAILTPDDEIRPGVRGGIPIKRARQNVIFELGYFFGFLGRGRVAAVYREGVELPTDLGGIAYIPLDVSGSWRLQLGRELKAAGLDVDLNRVV